LLITQPYLIRTNKRAQHRLVGKSGYVLGPLMVLSIVLLAHNQIVTLAEQSDPRRHFILFIQLGFALFFAVLYGAAMFYRRRPPIHARYMILTGILLIEPVLVSRIQIQSVFCRVVGPLPGGHLADGRLATLGRYLCRQGQQIGATRIHRGASGFPGLSGAAFDSHGHGHLD
jgi:hypothetical protein